MTPRVAVVHDYLTQRGGAERVALAIADAFPGAPVHTSVYDPASCYPELAAVDVRPAWMNRVGILRRHHRLGLPLYPSTFSHLEIDADVVVCSSSGFAHAARTNGRKVVYCHNPARWLYQPEDYLTTPLLRAAFAPVRPWLHRWDQRAAASADVYLANSSAVRDRVRAAYGLDARVVPPPPALVPEGPTQPVDGTEPGYVLCVARLLPYKHVDAVAAAAALAGTRLVVVGRGPAEASVRAQLGAGSALLSDVADPQLRWLYANAAGLVSASHEDFGLTPLEAAGFGVPSAVLRAGGFLDTVVEGVTGVFFDHPSPASIAQGLRALAEGTWSSRALQEHAERFSKQRFIAQIQDIVGSL